MSYTRRSAAAMKSNQLLQFRRQCPRCLRRMQPIQWPHPKRIARHVHARTHGASVQQCKRKDPIQELQCVLHAKFNVQVQDDFAVRLRFGHNVGHHLVQGPVIVNLPIANEQHIVHLQWLIRRHIQTINRQTMKSKHRLQIRRRQRRLLRSPTLSRHKRIMNQRLFRFADNNRFRCV